MSDLASLLHKNRRRPFLKTGIILLILLLLAFFTYRYFQKQRLAKNQVEYLSSPLKKGDISIDITATGNLAPTNQVTVGSEVSGVILKLYADENDAVKKNQILAEIDTSRVDEQIQRAEASLLTTKARVEQAKASLFEANAKLKRLQELHRLSNGKTPAPADMDTAVAAQIRANADLASSNASVSDADANVRLLKRDRQRAIIRSPVNGTVLTRKAELGQTVAASFQAPELFTIAEDLRKMDLVVSVAEADIARVKSQQNATFFVDAWPGRSYQANVSRVSFGSTLKNNVVTYNAELSVSNDDLSLRPGMTATANIFIEQRKNVLLVPNEALRFKPNSYEKNEAADAPKTTLAQSLTGPPRFRRPNKKSKPDEKKSPPTTSNKATIWLLENGTPTEHTVEKGLSDGLFTELINCNIPEGSQVITRLKIPTEQP